VSGAADELAFPRRVSSDITVVAARRSSSSPAATKPSGQRPNATFTPSAIPDTPGLIMEPPGAQYVSAADFKAPQRGAIEQGGYTIIANIGDQPSDLDGPDTAARQTNAKQSASFDTKEAPTILRPERSEEG
jgi:putative acid phosphatase of HAD superfamily subfamily IIIB